jgi:hypothetical protein
MLFLGSLDRLFEFDDVLRRHLRPDAPKLLGIGFCDPAVVTLPHGVGVRVSALENEFIRVLVLHEPVGAERVAHSLLYPLLDFRFGLKCSPSLCEKGLAARNDLSAERSAFFAISLEPHEGIVADIDEPSAFGFGDFRWDDYLLIREVNARPFEFLELSIRSDSAEKTKQKERY